MKPTKKTRRTDHAERLIAAPLVDVFSAFTSEAKLAQWLPPEGATGEFEHVDLRAGGGFLMRLTFDDADVESRLAAADHAFARLDGGGAGWEGLTPTRLA